LASIINIVFGDICPLWIQTKREMS
jgi:hypothetical protein